MSARSTARTEAREARRAGSDVVVSWREIGRKVSAFWRIPVIALLAGLIGFAASYAFPPVYATSTQLLVRGRDATFLTNSGTDLASQPGVVDASLAKALSETQSALLGSKTIARTVVDELDLDAPEPEETSLVGRIKGAVKTVVTRTRAYLTHGEYKEGDPYDLAVDEVHAGLQARQLSDSYVIELVGSGSTPEEAVGVTNVAADALVDLSQDRFRQDADRYQSFLGEQVERAAEEERAAAEELRAFKVANGIADVDLQIQLSTTSLDELRQDLQRTEVDLESAQAELASIRSSLANAAPRTSSESRIETGRSTTRIEQTGQSSVY